MSERIVQTYGDKSLVIINGHYFFVPWSFRRTWRGEDQLPLDQWFVRVEADKWDQTGLKPPCDVTLSCPTADLKEVIL